MWHHAPDWLGEVVVQPVDPSWVLLGDLLYVHDELSPDRALFEEERAHVAAHPRVFSDGLGADIARASERRRHRIHAQLRVDEGLRSGEQSLLEFARKSLLAQDHVG